MRRVAALGLVFLLAGGCAMTRKVVSTEGAPKAIGPYSQGIDSGSLVFLSGQVALDPATGQMVAGGIVEQTERALKNIEAVLK
ncbi:MAG TPA: Rid family hydrolase, partial [Planctomycetota bacterium]|nr:Rid family hydrolase [Planctomycetota bacterium]